MKDFLLANPELAATLATTVIWPMLTGLISLGFGWLEPRAPRLVAFLRATGLDASAVTALVERVIRAITKLPPPPTSAVLPLLLLVGASAGLSGCGIPAKVESALEASRDVAVFAESCAVEAQGLALERCATESCRAEAKAAFAPIADALDAFRAVWCGLSPQSEGCGQ